MADYMDDDENTCVSCSIQLTDDNFVSETLYNDAKIKYGMNFHSYSMNEEGIVNICNRCFIYEKLQEKYNLHVFRDTETYVEDEEDEEDDPTNPFEIRRRKKQLKILFERKINSKF